MEEYASFLLDQATGCKYDIVCVLALDLYPLQFPLLYTHSSYKEPSDQSYCYEKLGSSLTRLGLEVFTVASKAS